MPSYDQIAVRVAVRYGREFSSPEALKTYLHEHPKADPKRHTVQEGEEPKDEEEAPEKDEKPKGGLLGRLKGKLKKMSDGAKKVLTDAPKAVQTFFTDEAHRRQLALKASEAIAAAPGKYVSRLVKTAKHEAKEFADAGKGVAAVMRGKKMTPEQKHATKTVAKHMALVGAAAAFSVVGAGAIAGFMGKTMIKHIAIKAAAESLADLHNLSKVGIIGKGILTIMTKLAAEKGEKVSPEDALAALVMAKVMDQMGNLTDDDMADILEAAAKSNKKEAALRVAARYQLARRSRPLNRALTRITRLWVKLEPDNPQGKVSPIKDGLRNVLRHLESLESRELAEDILRDMPDAESDITTRVWWDVFENLETLGDLSYLSTGGV